MTETIIVPDNQGGTREVPRDSAEAKAWLQQLEKYNEAQGELTPRIEMLGKTALYKSQPPDYLPKHEPVPILGIILVVAIPFLYFLPSIVALNRKHMNGDAIAALNLFLGWTILGWILALVWSLTSNIRTPA